MKKTKWLAAVLMTAALVMGTCPAALAEGETSTTDTGVSVNITKIYSLLNSLTQTSSDDETEKAPTESFGFKVEKHSFDGKEGDISKLLTLKIDETEIEEPTTEANVRITYKDEDTITVEGKEKKVSLTFPLDDNTPVGEYVYKITEVAGKIGGMVYDTEKIVYAKITVYNDPDNDGKKLASIAYKTTGGKVGDGEGFVNRYQAGNLEIKKTVTGNMGNKDEYFEINVTLMKEDEDTKYSDKGYTVTGGSYDGNPSKIEIGKKTTFYLKHTDTIKILNVPYGVTYTVTEENYTTDNKGNYDAAKYVLNGTRKDTDPIENEKLDNASETVEIVNNKQTGIDTGVILDNMPYIVLLIAVIGAAVALFLRRRTDIDRD